MSRIGRSVLASACFASVFSASALQAQTLGDLYPQLVSLLAADGVANDYFGASVAISGDTLAVGAPNDDVGGVINQGTVRIYIRSGASWVLQATLTAPDGVADDQFGLTLALDGDTLAVSAPQDAVGSNIYQGTIRIFARSGSTWTQQATLADPSGAASDRLGTSGVVLDGDTVVVPDPRNTVGSAANQGSVHVFSKEGTQWAWRQSLTRSTPLANAFFGASAAIDGDRLAIGVLTDNGSRGGVRMFTRSAGVWTQQSTLGASDTTTMLGFGSSVSLDGGTLAVGAPADSVNGVQNAGSVWIYEESGGTWIERQTLLGFGDESLRDFGRAVVLRNGTLLAASDYSSAIGSATRASVRVFARGASGWTPQATIASAAANGLPIGFGYAMALDGGLIALGTSLQPESGSAAVFASHRVYNATRNLGYTDIHAAILGGSAGDRLLVGAPAFAQANDIIDAQQTRYTYVALEPLTIPEQVLMRLANLSSFEDSPEAASGGLTVQGKLIAPASGTLTFQKLTVANEGQFMQRESTVIVNENLTSASGGVCYMQGPVLAETVVTQAGGQNRVAGNTDIFGDYTNAGATVVQRGILYIYGSLVNTGTMTGEVDNGYLPPAAGDGYSIGGDYAVSAESSLVLPNPVWWLRVGGDLDIAINDPARFVMNEATIEMTGLGDEPSQSLEVFARDLGAVDSGFSTTNFLLGALRVRAGATVELVDGRNNAPGKTQEAIYTNGLFVPAGATLVTNGLRIYTRAATIAGTVSSPADIVVVPSVPPCVADLYPDGIVNAADLGILLAKWGACSGSCPEDLNGDAQVNAADLSALLAAWGVCGSS